MGSTEKNYHFLHGGGEMGLLTRAFNWSETSIGTPDQWPQSLRTTVAMILSSKFPMFLWWGEELIQFYNDAYRPSLGNEGKHPKALGQKGAECWPEIWDIIYPLISQVQTTGEATWSEDKLIPIYRNGRIEDVYWTFGYSPVSGESGKVEGVLVVCTETTEKVKNLSQLQESEERFRVMAEGTDILIAVGDESSNATYFNKAWVDLTGRPMDSLLQFGWADLVHPDDRERYVNIYLGAFEKKEPFTGEFRVLNKKGGYSWLLAKGTPRFRSDSSFAGYISSSIDITERKETEAALKRSEQRFKNLITEAPVATALLTGRNMVIELANELMLHAWGRDSSVIGKALLEVMPELANQAFPHILERVMDTGEEYKLEDAMTSLTRNGKREVMYRDLSYKPIQNEKGEVMSILVMSVDVTEKMKTTQKLIESEQQVRTVVESAPFPIAVYTGKEMRVSLANKAIMDIWGKGYDVIGKLFTDVLPELGNQEVFAQIERVYATGVSFHIRHQRLDIIVNGKSRPYWFNYSFTPLFDAAGNVYGVMNTGVDNTDLILAKLRVEENEKNMRNTILKAPVAMCIFRGPQHVVEIANDRMITLWGRTLDDVLNKPIFAGLPEAKDQGFEQLLDGVYNTGETVVAEGVPITLPRNGTVELVFVNFVYEAFREAEGDISGVIAVATDVTSQVLARQKIEEIVAERTKELAEANNNLQRSNAELAQFAYIASHDLQEPIRKVTTFTQMLQQSLGNIDERSQKYLDKIYTSSTRMTTLIRDVLSYSQLSKDREIFKPVNLQELMGNITDDFELLIEQKGAVIKYETLPVINAIPLQMSQLFGNLISNALKFTRDNVTPVINITTTYLTKEDAAVYAVHNGATSYYNIEFRDNGIGFKQEHASQIFNIFQRLHGKNEYAGTGIGLAMCKKIVQNHHGEIYATSGTENGAVFNVILPADLSATV